MSCRSSNSSSGSGGNDSSGPPSLERLPGRTPKRTQTPEGHCGAPPPLQPDSQVAGACRNPLGAVAPVAAGGNLRINELPRRARERLAVC